jgi:hypothetical protein
MPKKNGLEVVAELKQYYQQLEVNQKIKQKMKQYYEQQGVNEKK